MSTNTPYRAYDMTPTGLRLKLLALLNDHPSCQTVLRDWEWYLGRELQSSDFAVDSIADYVDALSGELREDQLITLQAILRAAWEVGHTAGLIDEEPPRS